MSPFLVSLIAAAGYAGAAAIEARHVRVDKRELKPVFVGLMAISLCLHLFTAIIGIQTDSGAWQVSLGDTLSLSAWMVGALALALRLRQHQGFLLAPLLAGVALLTGASHMGPDGGRLVSSSLGLASHITLSLAAFGVLIMAGTQALLLAWQDKAMKQRRIQLLSGLPPIKRMERLLFDLIRTGWAVLTLALLSGWLFVEDLFAQHLVHKTLLSLLAWAIFAGLLIGRNRFGWRGTRATHWTLSGVGVLVIGTLGSKIVLELILERV